MDREGQTIYRAADYEMLKHIAEIAQGMVNRHQTAIKDEGTCCGGSGIKVKFIPKGKRRPRNLVLAYAAIQGNIGAWKACKPAFDYVRACGIDCFYDEGWMD